MEKKVISPWKKYGQIVASVLLDVFVFFVAFVTASAILGKVLFACGIKSEYKPVVVGSVVILGVLGLISVIYALSGVMQGNIFWMPNLECRDESALMVFVVIGVIVLIGAVIWYSWKTIDERIQKHKRAVGVKEFVVTDYTRGISDI
jgi:predicted membrane channel-forming protein YqfA (hemolysin III family)